MNICEILNRFYINRSHALGSISAKIDKEIAFSNAKSVLKKAVLECVPEKRTKEYMIRFGYKDSWLVEHNICIDKTISNINKLFEEE